MDSTTVDLIHHSRDLRATWQGRALSVAEGRMMVVVSSILAHAFDEAMAIMFRVVQPKCWDHFRQTLKPPFLCSCGKVARSGAIFANVILADGQMPVAKVLFASMDDYEHELRKLADKLKLSDNERVEFFDCAKKWIVCDYRRDPTMDPQDPDARRLVH